MSVEASSGKHVRCDLGAEEKIEDSSYEAFGFISSGFRWLRQFMLAEGKVESGGRPTKMGPAIYTI